MNGAAYGGGFDLAVMCDAAHRRRRRGFGHPEHSFTQVVYAPLHDLVGGAVARDLALTGRRIDADEAQQARPGEPSRGRRSTSSRKQCGGNRDRGGAREVLALMKAKILRGGPGSSRARRSTFERDRATTRLITARFVVVVASGLAYFLALGVVLPVVPQYVEHRLGGGSVAVGVAVGALFVGAVLLRPYVGRLGDRFGRRILIVSGAARRGPVRARVRRGGVARVPGRCPRAHRVWARRRSSSARRR